MHLIQNNSRTDKYVPIPTATKRRGDWPFLFSSQTFNIYTQGSTHITTQRTKKQMMVRCPTPEEREVSDQRRFASAHIGTAAPKGLRRSTNQRDKWPAAYLHTETRKGTPLPLQPCDVPHKQQNA